MLNDKIFLITHIADPDGATPIILSKLVYSNLNIVSSEIADVDLNLKKAIEVIDDYDYIYVIDLNISEELASYIDLDDKLKSKIKIFDHHITSIGLNKYSFINVIDINENSEKECGTSIYYKYLKTLINNDNLNKQATSYLVELVRLIDTWEWKKTNNIEAVWINNLYDIYGREEFINKYYNMIINNETFEFTDVDKKILEIESRRIDEYVKSKMDNIIKANINGINVGIVFAESNRSILGNMIVEKYKDEIDIAVLINMSRCVSYRSCKDNVDVNDIAKLYGGGGHKKAGGSPFPEHLHENVIKLIFKDIKMEVEDASKTN